MSHSPDVLRDLQARLRREPPVRRPRGNPEETGQEVHEIPRDDLVAAHRSGLLVLDREPA